MYGKWTGDLKGRKEDLEKCVVEISNDFISGYQCSRKRGYGKGGLFCKQHSKIDNVYVPIDRKLNNEN